MKHIVVKLQIVFSNQLNFSISKRDQLRTLRCYALLASLGTLFAWLPLSAHWHGFGLGLIVPGGSYLMYLAGDNYQIATHLFYFAASLGIFGAAIFLWFATGNMLAPPVAWFLLAVVSGFGDHYGSHDRHLPALWVDVRIFLPAMAFIGIVFVGAMISKDAKQNGKTTFPNLAEIIEDEDGKFQPKQELDPADLARLRFLLDRALQPVDKFQGFEWIDQFQSAAVRYQLNFAGYALAVVQHCQLPAFKGYMTEAQAQLIEKQRNPKVWKYWWLENFWGNLKFDGNPFSKDNIMFSGFCAAQIALFQGASGDQRFAVPGSFSVTSDKSETWQTDFNQLTVKLAEEHKTSRYGLIACEPNWVFPVCNSISFLALKAHQIQMGSEIWDKQSARLKQLLQNEFMNEKTEFVTCRSNRTGIALPSVGGALAKLLPSYFLNATFPDVAKRNWLCLRPQILSLNNGIYSVKLKAFWPIDVGNYRFTRIAGLAGAAATAAELGDNTARDLLLEKLDKIHPEAINNGVAHRKNASIWAHSFELIARCSHKDTLRNLVSKRGEFEGPFIKHCNYPDVLVARAVAHRNQLEVVLFPGADNPNPAIIFGGLLPNCSYKCIATGLAFCSDHNGEAHIEVKLVGRTELCLQPAKETT